MRNFRTELGVQLFERRGPRISLTQDGQRLAERVRSAMSELATALAECAKPGVIRISATPTFASRWLAPRLTAFTEGYDLAVAVDPSVELRAPGSFDVAIRSGRGGWPDYAATRLFPLELTPLYAPARYRPERLQSPEDLLSCQLIHSDDWPRWFSAADVSFPPDAAPARKAAFPTQDLVATAAMEGAGVALLSPRLFAREIENGDLLQPFDPVVTSPEAYWVLVSDQERRSPVLDFRNWIVRACGQV